MSENLPKHKPHTAKPVEEDGKGPGHRGEMGYRVRGHEGRHKNFESEPHQSVEEMLRETKPCSPAPGEPIQPTEIPEFRQEYEQFSQYLESQNVSTMSRSGREATLKENLHKQGPSDPNLPRFKGETHYQRVCASKKVSPEEKQKACSIVHSCRKKH
ncbi:hypothetical protein P9112_004033 [Eukaryota sp. TZLM1-RC]